jgi:hypothetical protein
MYQTKAIKGCKDILFKGIQKGDMFRLMGDQKVYMKIESQGRWTVKENGMLSEPEANALDLETGSLILVHADQVVLRVKQVEIIRSKKLK